MVLDYFKTAPLYAVDFAKAMQDDLSSDDKDSLFMKHLVNSKQIAKEKKEERATPEMIQMHIESLQNLNRSVFEFATEKMIMMLRSFLEPLRHPFSLLLGSLKRETETFANLITPMPDEIRPSKYRDKKQNNPEVIREKCLVLLAYLEMTLFMKEIGTDQQICSKTDPGPNPYPIIDQDQPTKNNKNQYLRDFTNPIHLLLSLKVLKEAVEILLSKFSSTLNKEKFESLKNSIISIFQTITREFENLHEIPPVHTLESQDHRKKIRTLLMELLSHPDEI